MCRRMAVSRTVDPTCISLSIPETASWTPERTDEGYGVTPTGVKHAVLGLSFLHFFPVFKEIRVRRGIGARLEICPDKSDNPLPNW